MLWEGSWKGRDGLGWGVVGAAAVGGEGRVGLGYGRGLEGREGLGWGVVEVAAV